MKKIWQTIRFELKMMFTSLDVKYEYPITYPHMTDGMDFEYPTSFVSDGIDFDYQ